MLTFTYTARNPATGQKVKSIVQADNERAAARLIRDQGLAPIDIKVKSKDNFNFFTRIKTKDRILFARQLSTLINAGLPLVQSMRLVQKQTASKRMQEVIGEVITDIESGKSFADSLKRQPKVFDNIFCSMVSAGEASGTLDTSLERLALQQEKDAETVSKIRGAMVYPFIVILVMIGVISFMLITVLPQVKILYDGIPGAKLPLVTNIMLAASQFIINFWWVVILVIVILAVITTRWARTGPGKQVVDRLKMKTPPFGPLFMKVYMARFSRTGSTLVASGVPLIQMLTIVSESINNVLIEQSVNKAIEKVKGGKSLADALEGDQNFLELVPNMLRIGEQSGSMEKMMSKTADYYEKEIDTQIKTISTIIEPLLMVILGVVALIIVSAVLLPIYGLAGKNLGGS